MKRSGVYSVTCTVTGDVYVGSSYNLALREKAHFARLASGTHPVPAMQGLYASHGAASFAFATLEECDDAGRAEREAAWINTLKPTLNTRTARFSMGRPVTDPEDACTRRHVVVIGDDLENAIKAFAADNGIERLTDAMRQVLTREMKSQGRLKGPK